MNSDDFRQALHADAAQQPPISPDLRAAVDRQVRRQRIRAIAVASPAVVVLLLGAALLLPRAGQDTTLSVADGGTSTTAVTTTVPPSVVTSTPGTAASSPPNTFDPATTETTVDSTSTVPGATTTAPAGPTSCGTVEVDPSDPSKLPTGDTGPFACFIKAFNARTQTDLTIIVHGTDGGQLTQKLTATPEHLLTVVANGSTTIKLPAMPFGTGNGGGGLVPDDSSTGSDCGTINVDTSAMGGWDSKDPSDDPANMHPDAKVFKCLLNAVMGSSSAHVNFVVHDGKGGTMTSSIELNGADHQLTVNLDGTLTVQLPDHLKVPEDVMNAMPSGHLGIGGLTKGLGGVGGWDGWPKDGSKTEK